MKDSCEVCKRWLPCVPDNFVVCVAHVNEDGYPCEDKGRNGNYTRLGHHENANAGLTPEHYLEQLLAEVESW